MKTEVNDMRSYDHFLEEEGAVFPGKTYVEALLKPVFNDQRDYLFTVMFDIHRAHVVMLAEQGILDVEEARTILKAVNKVAQIDVSTLQYDPDFEDLFFMMEAKIGEEIGGDLAGKMHIGRSRNDMGVAMYRLVLRTRLLHFIEHAYQLSETILHQAEKHKETYMTGYTHTQPAQPTTLGHYLLAVFDVLQRDVKRLWSAYKTVNRSPLGAAAMTTTGFPINREHVCSLLGFDDIVENAYDSIGGADYLLEIATAMMTTMANTGRWIQDFLQHVTREFGSFQVADPYVQVSSIMPQKRNPVSIEHSRALASSAYGEALTAVTMIHNTPFGDIVDTEDDLQPHLYRSFETGERVFQLMYAVITSLQVNKDHLQRMARKSCITITELADSLTRNYQVPFRKAQIIASAISTETWKERKELDDWHVDEINQLIQTYEEEVELTELEWRDIISPAYFVKIRDIQGGPNPQEVARMIDVRKEKLARAKQKHTEIVRLLLEKKEKLETYNL